MYLIWFSNVSFCAFFVCSENWVPLKTNPVFLYKKISGQFFWFMAVWAVPSQIVVAIFYFLGRMLEPYWHNDAKFARWDGVKAYQCPSLLVGGAGGCCSALAFFFLFFYHLHSSHGLLSSSAGPFLFFSI